MENGTHKSKWKQVINKGILPLSLSIHRVQPQLEREKTLNSMARQKQRWTSEEEEALRAGVEKYGTSKWKVILTDPQFASLLANRSNIDLKDKWRNLTASRYVPGSREEVRTPRLQGLAINQVLTTPEPSSVVPLLEYHGTEPSRSQPLTTPEPSSVVPLLEYHAAEPSRSSLDRKKPLGRWSAMIFEALQSMEDSNGPDVNAILQFIEERYEVPQHCKRTLTANLRRLVLQGKLEKVDKCYKIKASSSARETSNPEQNNEQKAPIATETLEDASKYAAYAIAVAENKAHAAEEACKEAERFAKIAEESMATLKLAEELYEQCLNSPDGLVLLNP